TKDKNHEVASVLNVYSGDALIPLEPEVPYPLHLESEAVFNDERRIESKSKCFGKKKLIDLGGQLPLIR
ncbi:hypothetical protein BDZ91DRAFT_750431, partial [Kalaharituber pfeilii]